MCQSAKDILQRFFVAFWELKKNKMPESIEENV
jgi:hypothetical protein